MASENRIYGYLKSFSKGINSDVAPLLLPTDQLAFAVNATVRGNLVRQRPNFFKLTLVDNTSGAFQQGLYQGACYYRGTDGSIMCAVNGNLFKISIVDSVATVDQIVFSVDLRSLNYPNLAPFVIKVAITPYMAYTLTKGASETSYSLDGSTYTTLAGTVAIPVTNSSNFLWLKATAASLPVTATMTSADHNKTDVAKNWLRQAEQFLIWNDGVNLPAFYDGTRMRRSFGGSISSIGTTAADFVVPEVGQVINNNGSIVGVALSEDIPSNYWNQPLLIGVSQFVLLGTHNNNISSFSTVTANVLQSTTGDILKHSTSEQTKIYTDRKYLGVITSAGVSQNVNDAGTMVVKSYWDALLHPVTGTPATSFVVNIPHAQLWDINNPYYSNYLSLTTAVGQTIMVNGLFPCTVNSVSDNTGAQADIWSMTLTPQTNAATGVTVSSLSIGSMSYCTSRNGFGQCTSTVNTPTGSVVPTNNPVMNGGTGSKNNYFTVTLQSAPNLPSGSYTFQAKSGSTAVVFTGTAQSGSSVLTNCQISTPAFSNSPSLTIAELSSGTYPTSINQLVTCNSASSPVQIGAAFDSANSTPNYSRTILAAGSTGFEFTMTAAPLVGSFLVVTQTSGSVDIFAVTAVSGGAASSLVYGNFQNQTGTPDNIIPKGTAITPIPEMDVQTVGAYGMGRNWYSKPDGINFLGGDIVGGSSGTNFAPNYYNYSDAVLKISQNQFLAGGTTFKIPNAGEKITAMQFTATLDASLGQGFLQVFTDNTVFSCNAPADQSTWSTMTSPILTESLIGSGAISQDAVVQSNGDLIFRLADGGIQSMLMARLDFNKWGNTPISMEVSRSIAGDNPALIPFTSSVVFCNRALMTCQPVQSARGVYFPAMVALNFDPISSLAGKSSSIWDGEWNGLNVLKLVAGFFDGVRRCFALCLSADLTQIEVHEILLDGEDYLDDGTTSVQWSFETPMIFQREQSHQYKQLLDGEIYLDSLKSDVGIQAFYKVDQNDAWTPWYSTVVKYQPQDSGFRPRIGLGQPTSKLFDKTNNRPLREGYDFQVKLQFTGSCRFLGGRFAAEKIPQPEFAKPI